MLGERVLGLDQDAHQRVFVERFEGHHDRKPADQLGNEPEPQQIVGLDLGVGILDVERAGLRLGRGAEADLLPAGARLDDLLQPVEGAAADEQDVLGVDLDVFLLRDACARPAAAPRRSCPRGS